MRMQVVWLCVVALVAACSDGSSSNQSSSISSSVAYHAPRAGDGYPADESRLTAAVESGNQEVVREHAWDLWAAITAPSGERFNGKDLPIWETWYSSEDIYGAVPVACGDAGDAQGEGRDFESPVQHFHSRVVQSEAVTSINRFTKEVVDHVCAHDYEEAQTLDALNDSFGTTVAVGMRTIEPFPFRAIALKPVFQIVKQGRVTILPYWAGVSPATTSNVALPTPDTWRQCVAVVPPGVARPASPVVAACNDVAAYPADVFGIDEFYWFQLTPAEVAEASDDADLGDSTPEAGDYVVLVAMHVTSKEIPNWTWQTYWWSPFPDTPPFGDDRTVRVRGEWRNYEMCTAYTMTGPPETATAPPQICFNPYLETGLTGLAGTESNCQTCHRLAAWPDFSTDYQASGLVSPDDAAIFGDNTKLDFLWSVTRAH